MSRAVAASTVVDVVLDEPSETVSELAEQLIRSAVEQAPAPVMHARVRLIRHSNPSVEQAVVARAVLALPMHIVRAEAAGASEAEALDRLHDRVVAQLQRPRHGTTPSPRAPYFARPPEQRQIILHASVSAAACDLDRAAADMAAMDYSFHLFTETGSGQDSVLYRDAGGYALAQVAPMPDRLARHVLPVTVIGSVAPLLTVAEAAGQLATEDEPFLFFLDADRVCGAVIYHRYDGHYGLVVPAAHAG
jgi:hypothetical protein